MPAPSTTVGKLVVELILKDKDFQKKTKESGVAVKKSSDLMKNSIGAAAKAVTIGFTVMTAAATAFAATIIKTGSQFEKQMALVGAIADAAPGTEGFQKLTDQARELGRTTLFTAVQAGQGLEELVKAGLGVERSITASADVLNFAGSTATDLGSAAALTAATMAQFSLAAEESTRVVDTMSRAVRNSLLDVTSLREGMKFAGTAGAAFGNSLEQTSLGLALFRNLGLEGSLAGTNFRRMLVEAAQGSDRTKKALKGVGLELEDINPELNSTTEIFIKLAKSNIGATDALKAFGIRSGAFVSQIATNINAGREDFARLFLTVEKGVKPLDNLIKQFAETEDIEVAFKNLNAAADEAFKDVENRVSSAEDVYQVMVKTLSGQTDILISRLTDLKIAIFEEFREPLTDVVTQTGDLVQLMAEAFEENSVKIRESLSRLFEKMSELIDETGPDMVDLFISLVNAGILFMETLVDLIALLKDYKDTMVALSPIMAAFRVLMDDGEESAKRFTGSTEATAENLERMTDAVIGNKAAIKALTDARQNLSAEEDPTEFNKLIAARQQENRLLLANIRIVGQLLAAKKEEAKEDPAKAVADARAAALEAARQERKEAADREKAEREAQALLDALKDQEFLTQAQIDAAKARLEGIRSTLDEEAFLRKMMVLETLEVTKKADLEIQKLELEGKSQEIRVAVREKANAEIKQLQDELVRDLQEIDEQNREQERKNEEEAFKLKISTDKAVLNSAQNRLKAEEGLISKRKQIERQKSIDLQRIEIELQEKLRKISDPKARARIFQDAAAQRVAIEKKAAAETQAAWGGSIEQVQQSSVALVQNVGAAVGAVTGIIEGAIRRLEGLVEQLTGFSVSLDSLIAIAAEAQAGLQEGATAEAGRFVTDPRTAARQAVQEMVDGAVEFAKNLAANIGVVVSTLAENIDDVIIAAAGAIKPVVQALVDNMPTIIGALTRGIRLVVRVLVKEGPKLVFAIIDNIEPLIRALIAGAEKILLAVIKNLPELIDGILDMAPRIMKRLLKGITRLAKALIAKIPDIAIVVFKNIPDLFGALIEGSDKLLVAIIDGLLTELLPRLPEIAIAFIGMFFKSIVQSGQLVFLPLKIVKAIILGLIEGVPKLVTEGFPFFWEEAGKGLKSFAENLWIEIVAVAETFRDTFRQFFQSIIDAVLPRFLRGGGERAGGAGGAARTALEVAARAQGAILTGGLSEAVRLFQDGIQVVPHKMFALLHPGEAVVPADRNPFNPGVAARAVGEAISSGMREQPAVGGGGIRNVNLNVMMDGRLVDGVLVTGEQRGTMPKLKKRMRKASGVKAGIDHRNFQAFVS